MRSTVDLCKYMPSMSYFWAPYACPHRVSTALPIPNERGSSDLEVIEVAGEDLGGHGHDIVDHVNNNGRSSKVEEELELDPCSGPETLQEGQGNVGQYSLKLTA